MWPGGVMVKAFACDSSGREFNSRPSRCQITTLGNLLDPVVDRVERTDRLGCFVDRLDRLHRLVAMLITAFCSCLLTAWQLTQKICVQAPDVFPVRSGRPYWPSFPFLLPPLNIFIVGSRDHKMRSMRPVPKLLWPLVEL